MSREAGTGELEFLQALVKRGFVHIPRMLFDYSVDLELDYDTIGKIFAVLACVGGPGESPFGAYTVSRRLNPHDFDQVRHLTLDLEGKDLVQREEEADKITFSFIPLYARLRALWVQALERYTEEAAAGTADPAILAAERLLGRPLSDREIADIHDWDTVHGFGPEMVQAIIKEGQRLAVTRMSYLNQIAKQWAEEGVRTPEEAEVYVTRYRKAAGKHKRIIQYLGLNRQLTGAEQGLLDKWTDEWGFSDEVIMRAGEAAAGSRNPLQYMNRVLESWQAAGVKTVADVDRVSGEHKRRSNQDGSRSNRSSRGAGKSNVILQREKKDDDFYDHLYKKFGN